MKESRIPVVETAAVAVVVGIDEVEESEVVGLVEDEVSCRGTRAATEVGAIKTANKTRPYFESIFAGYLQRTKKQPR